MQKFKMDVATGTLDMTIQNLFNSKTRDEKSTMINELYVRDTKGALFLILYSVYLLCYVD